MPDALDPGLRQAVDAVVSRAPADFRAVYARSPRRLALGWTGLGLSVAAAAFLAALWAQPAPLPAFDRQVEAFVAFVYED